MLSQLFDFECMSVYVQRKDNWEWLGRSTRKSCADPFFFGLECSRAIWASKVIF